jgi:hypothetical protein
LAFDINDFTSHIQTYGYSGSSKFDVQFSLPNFLVSAQNDTSNQQAQVLNGLPQILQFRADNVVTPTVSFLSNDSNRYGMGPIMKQPFNAVNSDVPMTFLCDKNGLIYYFFYAWMNAIYNFSEQTTNNQAINALNTSVIQPSYTSNFEDNVISEVVTINTYGQTGNVIQTVNLYRVKPILMVGIPLGWERKNNLMKLSVLFNYREWSAVYPQAPAS